jgi:hypothetical protein
MTFPGSMGVSDATSAANIQTYIDLLIANGGTGCLHVHLLTLNSGSTARPRPDG